LIHFYKRFKNHGESEYVYYYSIKSLKEINTRQDAAW